MRTDHDPWTARYERLERQLGAATSAELEKIRSSAVDLSVVMWDSPPANTQTMRRIAIVAADAGNVRLRLNPLRISFVRVASSAHREPLGELVFPSEIDADDLVRLLRAELGGLLEPLDRVGFPVDGVLASTSARTDRLAAVREVLEWGAVLDAVATPSDPPILVVRDGLLRSIGIENPAFEVLRKALLAACADTGNRLVAVAKQVPGGADLANALLLAGVLDRRPDVPIRWLRIPDSVERKLLPGSFVVGRRMGPLLLVQVRRSGAFVPVETATADDLAQCVSTLFADETEYWPEPGMPVEVAIAHERARISALDREWLHRAFLDRLRAVNPQLANRALAAEIIGVGGAVVTEEAG